MSTTAGATPAMDMAAFRKLAKYPLIKASDMSADMREDAIDIISISVEKHAADLEKCAKVMCRGFRRAQRAKSKRCSTTSPDARVMFWTRQVIKEAADAKFGGGPFHCVVGQVRLSMHMHTHCQLVPLSQS